MEKILKSSLGVKNLLMCTSGVGGGNCDNHKSPLDNKSATATGDAISPKSRNKNEEAMHDLRHRIPDIDSIFDLQGRIGNGTFSTVLLATLKKDRELPERLRRKFAIKHHIPTSHPDRIIKELKCMVDIGGTDNVVGINCTIRNNESVAFVMPYMQHDRFHDFFSKMDLHEVQCYMQNLLIALRRVHKFNVIHRDVKPSNFLYSRRRRQFLLVDFGLAQALPHTTPAANESKRSRERTVEDEAASIASPDSCKADGDAKRIRCVQNNQRASDATARMPTAVVYAPFKMPLKQINAISRPNGRNSQNETSPLSRQVKSAILGATMTNRLQQKMRNSRGKSSLAAVNSTSNNSDTTSTTISAPSAKTTQKQSPTPVNETSNQLSASAASTKYNTNRNLISSAKCFCYSKPQVCNVCLVKKEIHASRAGTPGYRPPEVLLKYADQTTAVDIWAVGVIFLSILSSVYPFFKAPNDYVALAEMVTIFGDKAIRKTAFTLDRLVTLSQRTKPLDLRKLCVRFRNRAKFSSPELLSKYKQYDGTCEICKNCDQFYFNCLCADTVYTTEPMCDDDLFPPSAYDLLYRLLEVNPHKRITAEDALNHPFFNAS